MPKSRLESEKFWDRESPKWVEQTPLGPLAHSVRRFIKDHTQTVLRKISKNLPIVDLGTGANTQGYFDDKELPRIIGLDISREMLKRNAIGKKVVALLNKDLPFKAHSIGLLTSFLAMRYQTREEHLNLLQEAGRVLIPGGALLIVDVPLNKYDYQYSSFNAKALAQLMESCDFENVSYEGTTLEITLRGPNYSGFGGDYETFRTSIAMVVGWVSQKGIRQASEELIAEYLIASEDGQITIKTATAPPPF